MQSTNSEYGSPYLATSQKKERLEEELVQRDCVRGIRDQRQREFRKEITPTLPLTHLFGRDPKQLSYVCEREHVLSTSC